MITPIIPDSSAREVDKLDLIDRKVLSWLLNNKKSSVGGWIQFVCKEYRTRGIEIDSDKLWMEVEQRE